MESQFSEFQYAYSATRELETGVGGVPPLGIPWIPSLRQEEAADVEFRDPTTLYAPVFVQFKLTKFMTRPTATFWDDFSRPFFRFRIWPAAISPQHNNLVALGSRQPFVFYCVPDFVFWDDYQDAHRRREILIRSSFFPCAGCPPNSGRKWHSIIYTVDSDYGLWRSEVVKVRRIGGVKKLLTFCIENRQVFANIPEIVRRLHEHLGFRLENAPEREGPEMLSQYLLVAREIALVKYGTVMGLLPFPPSRFGIVH